MSHTWGLFLHSLGHNPPQSCSSHVAYMGTGSPQSRPQPPPPQSCSSHVAYMGTVSPQSRPQPPPPPPPPPHPVRRMSHIWGLFLHSLAHNSKCWLTHCGLTMPHGNILLGQHWFRWWLSVWRHKAITWTHGDLSLSGVLWHSYEKKIQEVFMNLTRNMCNLMMCKKPQTNKPPQNQVHYGPMVIFVCLHITQPHYYHYADVSGSVELLKCLFGLFCLVRGWKIKSILSTIFHAIYEAVFIQLTQMLLW